MTIIEFFDSEMLENILGTLIFHPERVILFGKDYKKIEGFQKRILPILSKKGIKTEISVISVNTNDFFAVKKMLYELTDSYPDCVFDLLGGDESVLTAMGAVSSEKNIPLCSINPRSKKVRKFFPDGTEEKKDFDVSMTTDDMITLSGGTLTAVTTIAPENEDELLKLWSLCREDCGKWNAAIETLGVFIPSKEECPDFDGMTVRVSKKRMEEGLKSNSYRYKNLRSLLLKICAQNLVTLTETGSEHIFKFQNPQILSMLGKAGNVLELYTLYSVFQTKKDSSLHLVTSAASSAVIDWENPPDDETEDDVKNEIDVLATVGAIPVFVSCKNGGVDSDELYKLNTVAERFGGKYARKILVMTYYDVTDSFVQRAHAMNIRLIRNVQNMTHDEFVKKLADNIR